MHICMEIFGHQFSPIVGIRSQPSPGSTCRNANGTRLGRGFPNLRGERSSCMSVLPRDLAPIVCVSDMTTMMNGWGRTNVDEIEFESCGPLLLLILQGSLPRPKDLLAATFTQKLVSRHMRQRWEKACHIWRQARWRRLRGHRRLGCRCLQAVL